MRDRTATSGEEMNNDENRRVPGRTCGDCTQCCKLIGVEELQKPPGKWCELVQIGKSCKSYDTRPKSCRDFECLWLQSVMPDELRPDRIKAVFSSTVDGQRSVVYIDPNTPDHWKKNRALSNLILKMRQVFDVIIVCGDRRTLLPSRQNAQRSL